MVVNLATPQYTVQDLTYRNEQGRTGGGGGGGGGGGRAPPPPVISGRLVN